LRTIIYYTFFGEKVKELCPIIPLKKEICNHLSHIINLDYDYKQIFNYQMINSAIESHGKIDQIDFSFLNSYYKIIVYG
jgi:hypothetical protein